MTRSYSTDLRVRVIKSISDVLSRRRAAARFGIGVSTAVSWYRRYREAQAKDSWAKGLEFLARHLQP